MRVYLAGTITADPATHNWRGVMSEHLRLRGHTPLSPLRRKDVKSFSKDGLKSSEPASLFVRRDENDIRSCDLLLLYTLGVEKLERQSIGTWAEMGMAHVLNKPIIVIANFEGITTYPFITVWAAKVVPTISEALDTVDWMAD